MEEGKLITSQCSANHFITNNKNEYSMKTTLVFSIPQYLWLVCCCLFCILIVGVITANVVLRQLPMAITIPYPYC